MDQVPQPAPPEMDLGSPAQAAKPPKPPKPPCAIHPAAESVGRCDMCKKTMCEVCDFAFPGHIHVCPVCVSAPPPGIAPRRTFLAITGIALSVIGMAVWGALVTGAFGQLNPMVTGYMILLPIMGAFACSLSAIDRRLGNNALLWISAAISSLVTAVVLVTSLIGTLNQ